MANTSPAKRPPPRGKPIPKEVRELAKSLYVQGLNWEAIAHQTGVSQPTLNKWVTRGGWVALRDQTRHVLHNQGQKTMITVIANDLIHRSKAIRHTLAEEVEHQAHVLRAEPANKAAQLAGRNGRAAVLKTIVESAATIFDWADSGPSGLVVVGDMEAVERLTGQVQHTPDTCQDTLPDANDSPAIDVSATSEHVEAPDPTQTVDASNPATV